MKIKKKWLLTVIFASSLIVFSFGFSKNIFAKTNEKQITIDGKQVDQNPANRYQGFGFVSANGTSRLLLDYKYQHPRQYWQIMDKLFSPKYGATNMIKVEMGADVNTSTATTPATMRTSTDSANTKRDWDWQIVADAKKINPQLKVDMLRWAEPKWVDNEFKKSEQEGFAARYKWYKETIDSAYDTYGIKLNYVSADKNEINKPDVNWIKYLAQQLDNERNGHYDYRDIQLVASDQNGSTTLPTLMKNDVKLREAVDVVSEHYNAYNNSDMREINQKYHKPIWYSEGVSSSTFAEYRLKSDQPAGGLGGTNGALDVANRFINMYQSGSNSSSYMTRYEFQPPVSAFYDGGQYSSKELIDAETPWSGGYYVDSGLPVTQQFTQFISPGWLYVKGASFGDGKQQNNGFLQTTNNYLTLTSQDRKDYSVVLTNNTNKKRNYTFKVKNLMAASKFLRVWTTKGPRKGQQYDSNWLKRTGLIRPYKDKEGNYVFTYSVQPNSITTLTTTKGQFPYRRSGNSKLTDKQNQLSLPYKDHFEYSRSYTVQRGGTPRYFENIGGSFEVVNSNDPKHGNVLQGMVDNSTHASGEWNNKPGNDAVIGDASWSNYKHSADFKLDIPEDDQTSNYAALLVRNQITRSGDDTGYMYKVYKNGKEELTKDGKVLESDTINNFDSSKWHHFSMIADDNTIQAQIDGKDSLDYTDSSSVYATGRVGVSSGYYHTRFDNLKITKLRHENTQVNRSDDLSDNISYQGDWKHQAMTGFGNYNRSLSTTANGSLRFKFVGTGFNIVGGSSPATIDVTVDGKKRIQNYAVTKTTDRAVSYYMHHLRFGRHNVQIKVTDGELGVDAVDTQ